MSGILDASFLVKLVLEERGSGKARGKFRELLVYGTPYTLDIALAEALNAIWKHAYLVKDLGVEAAWKAASDLVELFLKLSVVPTATLYREALKAALATGLTVYDSLYIAAAKSLKKVLYTFDREIAKRAGRLVSIELLD